jgi:hypothetical protein
LKSRSYSKNNSEFYNEHKTAQEQLRKKFAIISNSNILSRGRI